MPMQPATSGTLSMMLDSTPMMPVTMKWLPLKATFSPLPMAVSAPISDRQATDIRMPRKKRMVLMSMLRMRLTTRFCTVVC